VSFRVNRYAGCLAEIKLRRELCAEVGDGVKG